MNTIVKAETLINKGVPSDAVYVANCLDELLKQLTSSKQNVDAFYCLFLKLLDRVFGEDVTLASASLEENTSWTKGVVGGWLKIIGESALSRGTPGIDGDEFQSLGSGAAKLLKHFASNSVLFDVFTKLGGECVTQLAMLPFRTQLFIGDHPSYIALQSDNSLKICCLLLKTNALSSAHKQAISGKGLILLDYFHYFLLCLMRYPLASSGTTTSNPFLVNSGSMSPLEMLHRSGVAKWVDGVAFLTLVQDYVRSYFQESGTSSTRRKTTDSSEDSGIVSTSQTDNESTKLKHRELFVRLAIEYWIDVGTAVRYNHHHVSSYRKQLNSTTPSSSTTAAGVFPLKSIGVESSLFGNDSHSLHHHPPPHEVVQLDSTSFKWTVNSIQCVYLLLVNILSSATDLHQQYSRLAVTFEESSLSGSPPQGGNNVTETILRSTSSSVQYLHMLQQPIFDMLRCIFACGDRQTVNNEVVLLSVELWLLWLEPWNAETVRTTRRGIVSTHSAYTDNWRPYVAANLHFYTTLLVCYFSMASKMNLSAINSEGSRNLFLLERVMQVFTPQLVQTIDDLSDDFTTFLTQQKEQFDQITFGNVNTPAASGARRSVNFTSPSSPRGGGSPRSSPRNSINIKTVQSKPLCLLAKSQHKYLFPDPRINDFKSDFGTTNFRKSSEENVGRTLCSFNNMKYGLKRKVGFVAKFVSQMLERLQEMTGLPLVDSVEHETTQRLDSLMNSLIALIPSSADYLKTGPSTSNTTDAGGDETQSRVLYTGKLTQTGKKQLVAGEIRCTVRELGPAMHYIDPLEVPVCTYEWPWLARLLIWISLKSNEKYHLPLERQWITCPWEVIYQQGMSRPEGSIRGMIHMFKHCFRVNLRYYAQIRVSSLLLLTFLSILFKYSMLDVMYFVPVVCILLYFIYEGCLPRFVR